MTAQNHSGTPGEASVAPGTDQQRSASLRPPTAPDARQPAYYVDPEDPIRWFDAEVEARAAAGRKPEDAL